MVHVLQFGSLQHAIPNKNKPRELWSIFLDFVSNFMLLPNLIHLFSSLQLKVSSFWRDKEINLDRFNARPVWLTVDKFFIDINLWMHSKIPRSFEVESIEEKIDFGGMNLQIPFFYKRKSEFKRFSDLKKGRFFHFGGIFPLEMRFDWFSEWFYHLD